MDPEKQILKANAVFTKNLYRLLSRNEGNVFFSPFSLHTVLSMVYQGAQRDTAKVLARTLQNPDVKSTAEGYKTVIHRLNSLERITLLTANKIYGMQHQEFGEEFTRSITENFESEMEFLDLQHPKEAAATVNKWVEEKTHETIKDIVDEEVFTPDLCLMLINAIYFKGTWDSTFNKALTESDKFWLNKNHSIEVQMMCRCDEYWYKEDTKLKAQIIAIPYQGDQVKMIVVLPTKGIEKLEKELVHADLASLGKNLTKTEVVLFLPKFKMEETIELKDVLSEIGLKLIFDARANFKGILDQEDLHVSKVIQKAFIEVDEKGTEAAAATRVDMVEFCDCEPEPIVFKVDHPAIFMLVATHGEDLSNVLFFGRLSHPKI